MDLQGYLEQKNISKYRLSKDSGVPKTTIMDICAGRSTIDRCSAKTVQQLACALHCSMEEFMLLTPPTTKQHIGSKAYLECGLPTFLQSSVDAMASAWKRIDAGGTYLRFDCEYCNLQSDINNAEVNGIISTEQAWHLREKYLRMDRSENT
ncbi:MAG: helix-turn-helix transcriptional regulator [Oscillospiraceae bacterium]|nr:helix-turn-helix transcriptional regulator [Oscillospiraceae bacterium]